MNLGVESTENQRSFWRRVIFHSNLVIAVCSFGSFSLAGKRLPRQPRTALALFNTLRFPLVLVPFLLTSLLNALNAIQRLGAFLDQDESLDVEIDGSDATAPSF